MLFNFLKTALRFLGKNKGYTTINIFGLSLGMAAFILLSLFVDKEFSYDESLTNRDKVYQVFLADTTNNKELKYTPQTMAPVGPLMVDQVPEIVGMTRFGKMADRVLKMNGGKYLIDQLIYTDSGSIDFFDLEVLQGNPKLGENDLLISKSEALRIFGSVDAAIGKTAEVVDFKTFNVAAVFDDLSENTHLAFDYLFSFANSNDAFFSGSRFQMQGTVFDWGIVSAFPLYIKTSQANPEVEELASKMRQALEPHQDRFVKLVRVDDIYFSELNNSYFGRGGDKASVQLYLIIALVILTVAIINYMNLATARYSKRSKEVGIRKTVGSHRWQMAGQFFIESLVLSVTSMVLAICLVEAFAPLFSAYLGKTIALNYSLLSTYIFLIGLSLVVGFLAGIYPSLYLSKFNPIQVLSGKMTQGKGGVFFRKVLVGFQFFTCLALISVTLIVLSQFRHMSTIDLGFDEEQIVGIDLKDAGVVDNFETFKNELLRSAGIESVTGVSFSVFEGSSSFYVTPEGKDENMPVTFMMVEPGFLKELGVEMELGQRFSDLPESELKTSVIINEKAAEDFDWEDPMGKTLMNRKVTGVTKDFIYGSAKTAIDPLMIMSSTSDFSYAYIKLSNGNVQEAMSHLETVFNSFSQEYPLEYQFLNETFAKKYEKEEKLTQIFTAFTVLAFIVSGLGILGLSIFIAETRVKEIGIRKVLGAKTTQLIWLLNSNITLLILIVSVATLPLVYYFMDNWLNEFTFRISISAFTLLTPLLLLLGLVWSILIYQSLKSAKANPVNALRTE